MADLKMRIGRLEQALPRATGVLDWSLVFLSWVTAQHGYGEMRLYAIEFQYPQWGAALVAMGHPQACQCIQDDARLLAWLAYLPHVSPAWDTVQVRTWKAELEAIGRAALATLPADVQDSYLLAHDYWLWIAQVGTFPGSPIRLGKDGPEAICSDSKGFRVDSAMYADVMPELQAVWQRRRALIEAGEFGPEYLKRWG